MSVLYRIYDRDFQDMEIDFSDHTFTIKTNYTHTHTLR